MRSRFCLSAILMLPLVCSFVAPPGTAKQTSSELMELRGKVVNSVNGEPVAGALVQISAPGQRVQFTSSDGTFVFTDLPPGSYLPVARKPGFFNEQELSTWRMPSSLPVAQGQQVILKLTPEAIIYGQVKKENGQPLEGVTVRALQWQVQNGQRQLVAAGNGATDDEGNFRLSDLRPGRYYLSFPAANQGGWSITHQLSSKKHEEEGYGAQLYPGVPDLESAGVIEVRAGAHVHIAQTLSRQRLFEVAGVVHGADPESGFNLLLTNSTGDMVQKRIRLDPKTGQFQIVGVPAGAYLLHATANQRPVLRNTTSGLLSVGDEDRPPLSSTLPLHVHSDLSGLVVVLGSGISIGVEVRDEVYDNGRTSNPRQVSLQMTPQEFPQSPSWITAPPAPGDRRSPTRFEGLAPGTYAVNATPSGPWYISSMRCGSVDLLRDDLTVSPGAAPPPIEVTLRGDGAQLTVKTMEKGQPAAAGFVVLSQEYPKRSVFFGSGYSLSVANLAPGTYYVIAMSHAENVEFRNPAAMQRYLTHATEVSLGPRANVTVTAEVQEPEDGVQ